MTQALYLKWRPQTFDDVIGQQHIVRTLRNALQTEHIHHAYLLAGPRGTGKTTTARLIAKAVNCLAPVEERPCNQCEICNAVSDGRLMDLIEIDAASNTGVDNIREILEKVGFRPTQARYKVYVIDEVHMLSTAAFNALLKTLEEPPEHVIFVLATTEVHRIPATVLSRCQRFEFRRIPLSEIVGQLQNIATQEEIETETEALDLIARAATGSMRDAISLLDQMAAGGPVTAEYVRLMLGAERRDVVQSLIRAWIDNDLNTGLQTINRAIDGGADPRQLARQTADFLRGLLLMRLGAGKSWADPTAEERPRFQEMAREVNPEQLVRAVRLFSQVASESRTGWQPQLPLELSFVEATLAPSPPPQAREKTPAPTKVAGATESTTARHRTTKAESTAAPAKAQRTPRRVRSIRSPKQTTAQTASDAEKAGAATAITSETLTSVQERWREIVRKMPVSLGALLRDATPLGVAADGALVLGFQHTFHREKVDQEGNRQKVEDILSQFAGQRVLTRCILGKDWQPTKARSTATTKKPSSAPPPPPEPPNPVKDELVQRAQEELGAVPKITD